jgi:hypothetical protein
MGSLSSELRSLLRQAVLEARAASEEAARAVLTALAVDNDRATLTLPDDLKRIRRGLRARTRQLGGFAALVDEVAYEQWHLMLFARFLAENELLMHPDEHVSVSLAECGELAPDLGEPDEWMVAARFASAMLPGTFRLDDPSLQVRYAPEGRTRLERILSALPPAVFLADDSLGWVYQFWQTDAKREVNASRRKVGSRDLAPVTQLFTEHYMVQFLLQNSLGAWWASRHPDSALVGTFHYLRSVDDGSPAAGDFGKWPDRVAEVTVMDPCCGSGHFLVQAFSMLTAMRMEDEGSDAATAGEDVLRENLFGLELDPRCTQIAAFAVLLAAWKSGGWRQLPVPNIACSGIPLKAPIEEWRALAQGGTLLESALTRLHILFRDADILGSLLDPRSATEISDPTGVQRSFEDVEWDQVAPIMQSGTRGESPDPSSLVLGADAAAVARAADLLSRSYWLVATNVPWLKRGNQAEKLTRFCESNYSDARADLATVFVERCARLLLRGGTVAAVSPQNWLTLGSYQRFREWMLREHSWHLVARLGSGAFETISGEVVKPALTITSNLPTSGSYFALVADDARGAAAKNDVLRSGALLACDQAAELANPDSRVTFTDAESPTSMLLADVAEGLVGMQTSDDPRYKFAFWELPVHAPGWERMQDVPTANAVWSGCSYIVRWEQGRGPLASISVAWKGRNAWGRKGVIVARFGNFFASLYHGGKFHQNAAVIVPSDESLVPPILAFCQSSEFETLVRKIDQKKNVTNASLVKVPFDVDRWKGVAEAVGPLPEPSSDDPTQWTSSGHPRGSTSPLQVAVARLVGYRWPNQASDDIDDLADGDGLVPLPAMPGELGAAERLRLILERAYGPDFSPSLVSRLLVDAGDASRSIEEWVRDRFFEQHMREFQSRPFVWHVSDRRKDGFSALVNYHRLDRRLLEKLTFTVLGSWIEIQQAQVASGTTAADLRLSAAKGLQNQLKLILEGESPFDIYVRWKSITEQPYGWAPDLDDGVRLNIRPFVEADVLRLPINRMRTFVKWGTDRGAEPDGRTRDNDVHCTLSQKRGEIR